MYSKDIDILNVILILISLALAFHLPFGLFIFSYAFLGPLHYLTEINWLKEKNYFIKQTNWIWVYVVLAFIISIPVLFKLFDSLNKNATILHISKFINESVDEMIMIAILVTIGLIYFKQRRSLILFLIISVAASMVFLNYFPTIALQITLFIPTIIHVYLFTLLFMIYGTINSKSTPGIIAIVLLFLAPIIIIVSKTNASEYNSTISDFTLNAMNSSTFLNVNHGIATFFVPQQEAQSQLLSSLGIKIQIFIAFAYTYHYLNWFSKTSIIQWNKNLSKSKIIAIITIWIFSIALYLYNFKIGFIALSSLSLIHVFLEFPLNATSIKGIFIKIKSKFISQ